MEEIGIVGKTVIARLINPLEKKVIGKVLLDGRQELRLKRSDGSLVSIPKRNISMIEVIGEEEP